MTRVFVVFAYFILMAYGKTLQEFIDESKEKVAEVTLECGEKLHTSQEGLQEIMDKKHPTTHDGKCLVSCVIQYFGAIDEKGNANPAKSKEYLEPLKEIDHELYQKSIGVIEICLGGDKSGDVCEIGAKIVQCLDEELRKKGVTSKILGFESN